MNASLVEADKKLLEELQFVVNDITADMENMRLHLASEKIYAYVWHNLADKILEESKSILEKNDDETNSRKRILNEILDTILKILHPFMPFVTEEIWGLTKKNKEKLLIIEKWPT